MTKSLPPATKRRRRSSPEVTDLLLRAATEEFKRHGYGATTASIARKAGTTETQLFRYFDSKADLFRESVFNELDRHFADFNARNLTDEKLDADVYEVTRSYIAELQRFIAEHNDLLLSLFAAQSYAPETGAGKVAVDNLKTYFEHGAAMVARTNGTKKPRIDPQLLVRISFGAVLANVMFKDWLFPGGFASEGEITEALIDFVIDGINLDLNKPVKPSRKPRNQ